MTQRKEPEFPQAPSTTAHLGLAPEIIKQSQAQISLCADSPILSTQLQIVEIVLQQNGCEMSMGWRFNSFTNHHQCRWVNAEHLLIVDIFENADRKLKISMHHLREWISPSDSLMPRFAKTLAYAISAAGGRVKYKQQSLAKYQKGGFE